MTPRLDKASPSWYLHLIAELDAVDDRANALAKPLTSRQLNWTPAPGVWSVGQCIEHLFATNEVYLGPIADSLVDRKPSIVQDITPGWFGRWFIRNFIEASPRTKRSRAPGKIKPGAQVDQSILNRFLASNQKVRAVALRARNYDVNRIRFRNPFLPVLRFSLGTGFEIIWKHQHRHLLQAERIRNAREFPGPSGAT